MNGNTFNINLPITGAIEVIKEKLKPAIEQSLGDADSGAKGAIFAQIIVYHQPCELMTIRGLYLPNHYAKRINDVLADFRRDSLLNKKIA